ncbi:MAG: flagellar hook capping FlgD N-terminal domain-containing protein [Planctomycetaceae bacterium]
MITTADSSRDQFLSLLVAQMQNQDPLEPVGQEEFIAQLAQFSTLEGIEKMNANFETMLQANQDGQKIDELTQGSALIGKTVEYFGEDGRDTGVVDAVEVNNNDVSLVVDGDLVSLDRIQRLTA